jgi:hypothetical protein
MMMIDYSSHFQPRRRRNAGVMQVGRFPSSRVESAIFNLPRGMLAMQAFSTETPNTCIHTDIKVERADDPIWIWRGNVGEGWGN